MMKISIRASAKIITIFGITIAILVLPLAVFGKDPPMIQRKSGGMSLPPPAMRLARQGDYWRDHGELERALAFYGQAIKINPKCATAYVGRAKVWEELGKIDKALADFNAAFKCKKPFYAAAARYRADLYQSLHRYQEAINDYSLVISTHPTDGLYFSRGNCYLKSNKPAMAIQDFNKTLSLVGDRSTIYTKRADAYFALNQNVKALADYNMTLKLDPEGDESKDGHEHLHKSKAEIYKRMGKIDLAKKEAAAAKVGRNANLDMAPFASDSMK